MKNSDRVLIAIVAGVVVLVGVAFVVALRQPGPAYGPDDAPEGVAYNYLFALQQGDYERAYGYLSPSLEGYPGSVDDFIQQIEDDPRMFYDLEEETSLAIDSSRVIGDRATVRVRETHLSQRGLFPDSYDMQFDVVLRQVDGAWRIISADFYWSQCWDRPELCK